MPDSCVTLTGACIFFVLLPLLALLVLSFQTLEPIEFGLNFNAITMSLEDATYSAAGLYFLGFGHWFIRFPRVIQASAPSSLAFYPILNGIIVRHVSYSSVVASRTLCCFSWTLERARCGTQTIEFVSNQGDLLHTRTSDGLPLTLGLSFQYRYNQDQLHQLYLTYKGLPCPCGRNDNLRLKRMTRHC